MVSQSYMGGRPSALRTLPVNTLFLPCNTSSGVHSPRSISPNPPCDSGKVPRIIPPENGLYQHSTGRDEVARMCGSQGYWKPCHLGEWLDETFVVGRHTSNRTSEGLDAAGNSVPDTAQVIGPSSRSDRQTGSKGGRWTSTASIGLYDLGPTATILKGNSHYQNGRGSDRFSDYLTVPFGEIAWSKPRATSAEAFSYVVNQLGTMSVTVIGASATTLAVKMQRPRKWPAPVTRQLWIASSGARSITPSRNRRKHPMSCHR